MDKKGFYISELRLQGNGLTDKFIVFEKGLNIVAGASDTGKSFILDCIDYMTGGGKIPKPIPERAGFERIIMEIKTFASDQAYTLTRNLIRGLFLLKKEKLTKLAMKKGIPQNRPNHLKTSLLSYLT